MLRAVKKASLNEKELNQIWIPAQALYGDLGDSETIKRALRDGLELAGIRAAAERKGINLVKFLEMEVGK